MDRRRGGEIVVDQDQLNEITVALDTLTAALDDDGALDAALQLVCQQVVRVVPEADMASVTLVRDGVGETAACTDQVVFDIDADQYKAGAGPCLEAAATGEIVRVEVEAARVRWPEFTRGALAAGVASYMSAPLTVDDRHAGALNLYGLHEHGFKDVDSVLVKLYLAAVEAALRATSRYVAAREQAAHLSTALVSRAVIDQAKGIIMGARGVGADQAFQLLVEQSQRDNVKLHDIAERLVARVTQANT
nr:GAF and ANTAR domain-containing protein [Kibdelosporangium sp. MJ126-NF4]CEL18203.1 GAF domain-containing protein [Kibdelosporangium sp. MJ126-NF4]